MDCIDSNRKICVVNVNLNLDYVLWSELMHLIRLLYDKGSGNNSINFVHKSGFWICIAFFSGDVDRDTLLA